MYIIIIRNLLKANHHLEALVCSGSSGSLGISSISSISSTSSIHYIRRVTCQNLMEFDEICRKICNFPWQDVFSIHPIDQNHSKHMENRK